MQCRHWGRDKSFNPEPAAALISLWAPSPLAPGFSSKLFNDENPVQGMGRYGCAIEAYAELVHDAGKAQEIARNRIRRDVRVGRDSGIAQEEARKNVPRLIHADDPTI